MAAYLGLLCALPLLAPPRPAGEVWLEGESCRDHPFTTIGRDAAFEPCYGSAILQLQTRAAAPVGGYHATGRPALPAAGWWEVRLAVTAPDRANLSPFSVQVGEYRARTMAGLAVEAPYGPGDIFGWLLVGTYQLRAGELPLTLRCAQRRQTGEDDFLVYVDALCLRQVAPPPEPCHWLVRPYDGRLSAHFEAADTWTEPVLHLAVEGRAEVSLNGEPIGAASGWDPALRLPLAGLLQPGHNELTCDLAESRGAALLGWVTVRDVQGNAQTVLGSNANWLAGAAPAREIGGPRAAPWGDLTRQPAAPRRAGKLPIPLKTGNLSVNLITAAAQGEPAPRPPYGPLAMLDSWRDVAGISSVEDYQCWLPLEPTEGDWRWDYYEHNAAELERRGMGYTVYPWLHFPPAWATASPLWQPLRCLQHDQTTWAPSIWSPATAQLFERYYAALAARLGPRVKGVYLSLICDYGEAGYPIGMADWVVPAPHKHPDFWVGDPLARADFRRWALARHGDLARLNAAWGTRYASPAAVDYPPAVATEGPDPATLAALPAAARGAARRRWLDFVDWYQDAMLAFTAQAAGIVRRHFPALPIEVKIGFGSERVMYGVDYTAYVAASRAAGYTVRSTHGKLPHYFYRRFSSAARQYQVPLVTEPPSGVSRDEEVARIFKDATSGTSEYFDYPQNLLDAADLFGRYGRFLRGQHSLTRAALFFPTTDHRLQPGQVNPPLLTAFAEPARLRFDWDIVDERLIRDGALARYDTLIWVEGQVVEAAVLRLVHDWVAAGGLLLAADLPAVECVEGDPAVDAALFVSRPTRPSAADCWSYQPVAPQPWYVVIGAPGDEAVLSSAWNNAESGHWEWGGPVDAVRKRWSGATAGLTLPVDPRRGATLQLRLARHPRRLADPASLWVNGQQVATVAGQRLCDVQVELPAAVFGGQPWARLELRTVGWQPSAVDGSGDHRTLGLAVGHVKLWPAGTSEPTSPVVPPLVTQLDLPALQRCLRPLGRGATLLSPFGRGSLPHLIALAALVIHRPGDLLPGRLGAPDLSSPTATVTAALLRDQILLLNDTAHGVRHTLHLDDAGLRRAGAVGCQRSAVTVTLPPHSLVAVDLPSGHVVAP
ncbi:MAG: family 14 glycosylhydrolase [Fimbriimonadaceae bacterium]|nr:family 14 glycosylhydrolase [Fimbriimonadaceae bacterium]